MDYIEIYDGPTLDSFQVGRYTGSISNYSVYTTSYEALVYFHSDATTEYRGFNIYFSAQGKLDKSVFLRVKYM